MWIEVDMSAAKQGLNGISSLDPFLVYSYLITTDTIKQIVHKKTNSLVLHY
jgi:hypothetical protein